MNKLTQEIKQEIKNEIILFIKFGKKNNLSELQKGKLYMNNFKYFSELEKKRNYKGMGDEYEGALIMQDINMKLVSYENKDKSISFLADNIKFRWKDDMLKPIFCITSLAFGDLKNMSIENKKISGILEFTDEQKEKIEREFGPYALIIPSGHLMNMINDKFNDEGFNYMSGKIKYSDYGINYMDRIKSCMSQHTNAFFWKDISLKYQKEYRIVILNKNIHKPFVYNIGDMTQFTKLTTTKELLNNKYEVMMNLKYPLRA